MTRRIDGGWWVIDRQAWEDFFGDRVRFAEPMSRHTSFRIGGPADVWVEVIDSTEIGVVQRLAAAADLPLRVFGSGSNVLVSDRGVRGVILHLRATFAAVEWDQTDGWCGVRAGAVASLRAIANAAVDRGLTGLEFAEGIPGTVGGGLLMNAGAFGGEMSQAITSVSGVDEGGEVRCLSRDQLRFSYRQLDLPPSFVVTQVCFRLQTGDRDAVVARRDEFKRRRAVHQPVGFPNAGSVFRNPPGEFAGRLIEAAGLKGLRRGGAMVAEQHANFIVNTGGATATDVRAVMDEAVRRVWDLRRIRLEPEIKLIGDWQPL